MAFLRAERILCLRKVKVSYSKFSLNFSSKSFFNKGNGTLFCQSVAYPERSSKGIAEAKVHGKTKKLFRRNITAVLKMGILNLTMFIDVLEIKEYKNELTSNY